MVNEIVTRVRVASYDDLMRIKELSSSGALSQLVSSFMNIYLTNPTEALDFLSREGISSEEDSIDVLISTRKQAFNEVSILKSFVDLEREFAEKSGYSTDKTLNQDNFEKYRSRFEEYEQLKNKDTSRVNNEISNDNQTSISELSSLLKQANDRVKMLEQQLAEKDNGLKQLETNLTAKMDELLSERIGALLNSSVNLGNSSELGSPNKPKSLFNKGLADDSADTNQSAVEEVGDEAQWGTQDQSKPDGMSLQPEHTEQVPNEDFVLDEIDELGGMLDNLGLSDSTDVLMDIGEIKPVVTEEVPTKTPNRDKVLDDVDDALDLLNNLGLDL